MKAALKCHPDSPSGAVAGIEVEILRATPDRLDLRYLVAGEISRVRIPPPAAPVRTEGLWNHTCFEAFLAGDGESYCEFNFSPSGEWAAWRFEAYRSGMVPLAAEPPPIEIDAAPHRLELRVPIALPPRVRRIGLSAVIEEDNGHSYWALAHPPGRPDFHAPACFALDLPPPAAA